jgi:hypothetical protein
MSLSDSEPLHSHHASFNSLLNAIQHVIPRLEGLTRLQHDRFGGHLSSIVGGFWASSVSIVRPANVAFIAPVFATRALIFAL